MTSTTGELLQAVCPECEYEFEVEDPQRDEVLTCDDCSLNLRVTTVDAAAHRVGLELTETAAEDWGE
ncbi:MAG TPA: lysine biosynthesis protein LysW [Thermoanaerobaculia bacterium]|nr:lysine biosynthesis protein LysW [Thermoanaerobaculia bacterium]